MYELCECTLSVCKSCVQFQQFQKALRHFARVGRLWVLLLGDSHRRWPVLRVCGDVPAYYG